MSAFDLSSPATAEKYRSSPTSYHSSPSELKDEQGLTSFMREAYTLESELIKNKKHSDSLQKEIDALRRQLKHVETSSEKEKARADELEHKLSDTATELRASQRVGLERESNLKQMTQSLQEDKAWLEKQLDTVSAQLRELEARSGEREKADAERLYMQQISAEKQAESSKVAIADLNDKLMRESTLREGLGRELEFARSQLSERDERLAAALQADILVIRQYYFSH